MSMNGEMRALTEAEKEALFSDPQTVFNLLHGDIDTGGDVQNPHPWWMLWKRQPSPSLGPPVHQDTSLEEQDLLDLHKSFAADAANRNRTIIAYIT